jgi:hypothetical protein
MHRPKAAITFDIDWAPDWCIDMCRGICLDAGIPATFFATHPSPVVEELKADSRFEVGIHPNFLSGSSHGSTTEEVLDYCLSLVPLARSMRTHALVQSSGILGLVLTRCPNITVDVSLLLPGHAGLASTLLHLGLSRPLIRLPYYWEDDVASVDPEWSWDRGPPDSEGLRIFDFHPVHVALNSASLAGYGRLKAGMKAKPLTAADRSDFGPYVNPGLGTRDFLERAISEIGRGEFGTIQDVAGVQEPVLVHS